MGREMAITFERSPLVLAVHLLSEQLAEGVEDRLELRSRLQQPREGLVRLLGAAEHALVSAPLVLEDACH